MKKYYLIAFLGVILTGSILFFGGKKLQQENVGADPRVLSVIQGGTGSSSFPALTYITGNDTGTLIGTTTGNFAFVTATSTTASSTFQGLTLQSGGLAIETIASCSGTSALSTGASGNVICAAVTGSDLADFITYTAASSTIFTLNGGLIETVS